MKGGKRTAKGRFINIDDVIASAPHSTAVGNMRVNAQGDKLGPGGEVIEPREKRTRTYYKNHPQSSNQKVSLKGETQEAFSQGHSDLGDFKPATSNTHRENARTAPEAQKFQDTTPVPETEPEQFDDMEMPHSDLPEEYNNSMEENNETEPDGYEEVQMENGDIVLKPYWLDQDHEDDL